MISRRLTLPALVVALGLAAQILAPAAGAQSRDRVAQAQELVDAERPEEALALLKRVRGRQAADAPALLLRSTAHFMLGDVEEGRRDLDRALELDPALRQGWLNRAALDITEERYEEALAALTTAEELDPSAPDNHLNIGTVLLLQGKLSEASERFRRYLGERASSADAYYVVGSNYAGAGYANLAVEHLRRAIELDERARVRARTDPSFLAVADSEAFQEVMSGDPLPPAPGSYTARQIFAASYEGGEGELLTAVLDALQLSGEAFDPQVEVTPAWAVIWGDFRVVVRAAPEGKGQVDLSAPADRFTPETWRQRTTALLRRVQARLVAGG